jgi:hypothetical protein
MKPPSLAQARVMGEKGAHHDEAELQPFLEYLGGHCWSVTDWNAVKRCFETMFNRVAWVV